MAIERLVEEIKKLTPQQKKELFLRLGLTQTEHEKEEFHGGSDDNYNSSTKGKDLLKFLGTIDKSELEIIESAIKKGCERIDYAEW